MSGEYGINETKEVLAFAFSLHKAYELAQVDGKIDLFDANLLIDPVMKLVPAIKDVKLVIAEFKDMDSAERAELDQWIKDNYDIADDELEAKIEKGFSVVLALGEFLGKF